LVAQRNRSWSSQGPAWRFSENPAALWMNLKAADPRSCNGLALRCVNEAMGDGLCVAVLAKGGFALFKPGQQMALCMPARRSGCVDLRSAESACRVLRLSSRRLRHLFRYPGASAVETWRRGAARRKDWPPWDPGRSSTSHGAKYLAKPAQPECRGVN
jgi:hypothetical protein